ncbi:MAG: hypothetical protein Q9201_000206 [Fulgogasparrea decipioides]
MDIDGITLVAGAGSGIGRQVALALASRGANTIVCADMNETAAQKSAEDCLAQKMDPDLKTHVVQFNVTDEESVQHMVDETKRLCGRIDHFVNTAGIGAPGQKPLTSTSLSDYRSMLDCHSIGSFLCLRAVLRVMLQQEPRLMPVIGRPNGSSPRHMSRGSIVIITSLSAETVVLGIGSYGSAKKAVKGLVETAALENARKGVRINAVAPTYVEGPMLDKYFAAVPGLKEKIEDTHALGWLITAEEVADTVLFLLSAAASYTNGQTLVLDGGSAMHLGTTHYDDI